YTPAAWMMALDISLPFPGLFSAWAGSAKRYWVTLAKRRRARRQQITMKAVLRRSSGGSIAPGLDVDLTVVTEPMQPDHTPADLHVRTLRATANRGVPDLHIRPFRAKRVALEQG